MNNKNIAIYFNHYQTLGHSTRALCIANALLKNIPDASISIIQAGHPQKFLEDQFPEFNWINIPEPLVGREWFINQNHSEFMDKSKLRKRLSFFKSFIKKSKPSCIVIEYFPFGRPSCKYEVLPVLQYVKNNLPNTKIVSLSGYPLFNFSLETTMDYCKYFDALFVQCPKELDLKYILAASAFSKSEKHSKKYIISIIKALGNKLIFTGYSGFFDYQLMNPFGEKPFILISRGGGAIYPKLIATSIAALSSLDIYALVVSGPATTKKEDALFNNLALRNPRIIYKKYIPNLQNYIASAELCISMAGYNTSVHLLKLSKKCIIIPKREKFMHGGIEQPYRARLLQDIIKAKIFDYRKLNKEDVAEAIYLQLDAPKTQSSFPTSWFTGHDITAKIIKKLM